MAAASPMPVRQTNGVTTQPVLRLSYTTTRHVTSVVGQKGSG